MNEPCERPIRGGLLGRWWLGVGLACGLGLLLRVLALGNEFWLDEIWSWQAVHTLRWPWQVLTDLRSDNNHHLNSLVLWFWPAGTAWPWYRLHSLLAGMASVVVAAWAAGLPSSREKRSADGVLAALLVASNYWLVAASTEARGYAFAVLFALLAWGSLRLVLAGAGNRWRVVFGLSVVLGFLSHLTFLHCYVGLFLWSLRHFARQRSGPGQEFLALMRLHGVPVALVGAFYLLSVRGMELGGGPPTSTWEVLSRLLTLGLGWAGSDWLAIFWGGLALVVLVAGLRVVQRADGEEWVFFLVTVVVSPGVFLLKRPPFLFERYFLISFVFFLVLLARVLGALWRAGAGRGSLASASVSSGVVLVLVLGANLSQVADFFRSGRGRFFELLALVQARDSNPVVTIAGDFDFRVEKYCDFYAGYLPAGERIHYVRKDDLPEGGVEWLFVHRVALGDPRDPPGEEHPDQAGNLYRLELARPGGSPAAWGWYVYRNANSKAR
jgi:hypothetical protein